MNAINTSHDLHLLKIDEKVSSVPPSMQYLPTVTYLKVLRNTIHVQGRNCGSDRSLLHVGR